MKTATSGALVRALKVSALLMAFGSPLTLASTLRIDNAGEPGTLDPQQAQGLWENHILQEMYEPLLTFDAKGNIIPGLASSWETSADGRKITFHLRDAKWSDGQPITADDAVFGLQRTLLPDTANPNAYYYYPILNAEQINQGKLPASALGVKALDAHTLEVTLTRPNSYILAEFAAQPSVPLPKHSIKSLTNHSWSARQPVVSGPYLLDHWNPHVDVLLKKNPSFYNADKVSIDNVVFYPIEDPLSAVNRYRTHTLDISYNQIPSARLAELRKDMPSDVQVFPSLSHYYYLPNMKQGQPLADKRIREAMNMTVQREVITDKVLRNGYVPTTSILPRTMSKGAYAVDADFQSWPMSQRIERARELMKEAGYDKDHPLALEMSFNSLDDHRRVAVAMAAMWKQIGVNVTLQTRDVANHYNSVKLGQFQLARHGTIPSIDNPVEMLAMFVSGSPDNRSGYTNPEFDRHVNSAITAMSPEEAQREWQAAQQIAMNDVVEIPVMDMAMAYLVSPALKGWEPNPLDVHPLRYVSLQNQSTQP
ncbi:peptide ABC transporter substrate-binding protein [Zymobacter sp. IVIA_12111.31 C1]|uniref:peptide ABC transporter substrate-binding protein n=1 Tax=Zymobacter sp. IVIA_12111.31 C1 TaxID=3394854 RepID=UPI0039C3ACDC